MSDETGVSPVRDIRRDDETVPDWMRDGWPLTEPVVHIRGVWPPPRRALAIVGTTRPCPEARAWAFNLARLAATHDWAIVSGLAQGIDAAAHEGALAARGQTIAVPGQGLDRPGLRASGSLAMRILNAGGTLIAFANNDEAPRRFRLLQRNALTSALSLVVLAIQARGYGGTMATMRHAIRQGRRLAACVPPADANPADWVGNELLLASASPWRLTGQIWSPAFPVDPSDHAGYVALLDSLSSLPQLDTLPPDPETGPTTMRITQSTLFQSQSGFSGSSEEIS